jgi:hypothetical protein
VWFFVHLAFLNGFDSRFSTMTHWLRSMVGRARPERVFSVAHVGGDLSTPESVRSIVEPSQFPGAGSAPRSEAPRERTGGSAGDVNGD